jgi:hypothetical protein
VNRANYDSAAIQQSSEINLRVPKLRIQILETTQAESMLFPTKSKHPYISG